MRAHMDLCSGIGGFAIAARRAGLETIQFCEIEPFCQAVLRKNFPGVPVHGDLRTFNAKSFRGGVFLLTAGFPCQDISAAGKGAGLTGKKSSLWWQVRRVVRECRPVFCLIENVPMLLHRGIDTVISGLERAGYSCAAFVVGACDVGAPHQRKRVWIVAYRRGVDDALRVGYMDRDGRNEAVADSDQQDNRLPCEAEPVMADRDSQPGKRRRKRPVSNGSSRVPRLEPEGRNRVLADTDRTGQREPCGEQPGGEFLTSSECGSADVADTVPGIGDGAGKRRKGRRRQHSNGSSTVGNPAGDSRPILHRSERANPDVRRACVGIRELADAPGDDFAHDSIESSSRESSGGRRERERSGRVQAGTIGVPVFPPARNDWDGWAVIAEQYPELLPATEREVCDMADELPAGLVRFIAERTGWTDSRAEEWWHKNRVRLGRFSRNSTLKALGNSIVPEVAYQFIKAILECEHLIGALA